MVQVHMALQHRRPTSKYSLLWEPEISSPIIPKSFNFYFLPAVPLFLMSFSTWLNQLDLDHHTGLSPLYFNSTALLRSLILFSLLVQPKHCNSFSFNCWQILDSNFLKISFLIPLRPSCLSLIFLKSLISTLSILLLFLFVSALNVRISLKHTL